MEVVRLPVPDKLGAREVLEKALKEGLTNVIVLSQREDGNIYHEESSGMTLGEINWLVDGYWFWLHNAASGMM